MAERAAYRIKQWCAEAEISEAFFFKRQREGQGPRVADIGSRTLVIESPREYLERFAREPATRKAVREAEASA
jgi:hypothetical protein